MDGLVAAIVASQPCLLCTERECCLSSCSEDQCVQCDRCAGGSRVQCVGCVPTPDENAGDMYKVDGMPQQERMPKILG